MKIKSNNEQYNTVNNNNNNNKKKKNKNINVNDNNDDDVKFLMAKTLLVLIM